MAVNKKSLTNSKSATKPATTKSVKPAAPNAATAATGLRFAKTATNVTTARAFNATTAKSFNNF